MIIRCDRCSTVYELDEGLLAPEGSPVQCARCANVFTARPARVAGQTLQGVPPPPEAPPREPPRAPPASADAQRAAAARPGIAWSSPTVYRPTPPSNPGHSAVARAPVLRRDTVGTFESRLRRSARWRWLVPAALIAVAAVAAAAWYGLRRTPPEPTGRAVRAQALALAERDDAGSLRKAAGQLDEVAATATLPEAAAADRALVELLLADTAPRPAAEPGKEAAGAEGLAGPIAQARATLAGGERAERAPGEVARARAVAAALEGNRDEVRRQATAARVKLGDDPWAALAEVWVEARSSDKGIRERAASALGVLAERRPTLLRARFALAQCLAASGLRHEAVAAADAVLVRNPEHERAAALRADLLRPPPQPPAAGAGHGVPPSAASASPPAPAAADASARGGEKGAALPRKPVAQPAESAALRPAGQEPQAAAGARRAGEPASATGPAEAGGAPPGPEPGADDPAVSSRPARLRPAAVPPPEPILVGE